MFSWPTTAATCSASTCPRRRRCAPSRAVASRSARAGGGFRALGDPTRLTIALALRDGGELCVCDLAWIVERAENLVSHHVRALRAAGLADYRRDGKMALYSLTERGRACSTRSTAGRCRRERRPFNCSGGCPASPPQERAALERRAKLLAWGGNAWHVVEFAIAVGAGIAAGLGRTDRLRHRQPDRARSPAA